MVKKIVKLVTLTGADDSVEPERLVETFAEYPFVEFGILFSRDCQSGVGFPSANWLNELSEINARLKKKLFLSAHLRNGWVRDICIGGNAFFRQERNLLPIFQRIQLDFCDQEQIVRPASFALGIVKLLRFWQLSFPMDGLNDDLFRLARDFDWANVVPLFDLSNGAGASPQLWPKTRNDLSCGYALDPTSVNLEEEMEKIASVSRVRSVWLEARLNHNAKLNLPGAKEFLEEVKPWCC